MIIKINIKEGEELTRLQLAAEISKLILETAYFDKKQIINGFLHVDKSIAKQDLEIDIDFKISCSEKNR